MATPTAFQMLRQRIYEARHQYRPNDTHSLKGHELAYRPREVEEALAAYEAFLVTQTSDLYETALHLNQTSHSPIVRQFARDVLLYLEAPLDRPALGPFPHGPVALAG